MSGPKRPLGLMSWLGQDGHKLPSLSPQVSQCRLDSNHCKHVHPSAIFEHYQPLYIRQRTIWLYLVGKAHHASPAWKKQLQLFAMQHRYLNGQSCRCHSRCWSRLPSSICKLCPSTLELHYTAITKLFTAQACRPAAASRNSCCRVKAHISLVCALTLKLPRHSQLSLIALQLPRELLNVVSQRPLPEYSEPHKHALYLACDLALPQQAAHPAPPCTGSECVRHTQHSAARLLCLAAAKNFMSVSCLTLPVFTQELLRHMKGFTAPLLNFHSTVMQVCSCGSSSLQVGHSSLVQGSMTSILHLLYASLHILEDTLICLKESTVP